MNVLVAVTGDTTQGAVAAYRADTRELWNPVPDRHSVVCITRASRSAGSTTFQPPIQTYS